MGAWLTIDFIAKRYGYLPSEVIEKGSSIDVVVSNLGVSYENYLSKKNEDGHVQTKHSQEELQGMLDKVRNK